MSRRMKLASVEKGYLEVLVLRSHDGVWEGDWDLLRDTPVGALFSKTSQRNLDHILRGYSKPFVEDLGIPPVGALRKLPGGVQCRNWKTCNLYRKNDCVLPAKKLPWCFEFSGVDLPDKARPLVSEAIFRWREGVYLVVVENNG